MAGKAEPRFRVAGWSDLDKTQRSDFIKLVESGYIQEYRGYEHIMENGEDPAKTSRDTPDLDSGKRPGHGSVRGFCVLDEGKVSAIVKATAYDAIGLLKLVTSSKFSRSAADFYKLFGRSMNQELVARAMHWGQQQGCRRVDIKHASKMARVQFRRDLAEKILGRGGKIIKPREPLDLAGIQRARSSQQGHKPR